MTMETDEREEKTNKTYSVSLSANGRTVERSFFSSADDGACTTTSGGAKRVGTSSRTNCRISTSARPRIQSTVRGQRGVDGVSSLMVSFIAGRGQYPQKMLAQTSMTRQTTGIIRSVRSVSKLAQTLIRATTPRGHAAGALEQGETPSIEFILK